MSKARDLANAGTALTTVSATELGYLDGVTSAVQTQINSKEATLPSQTGNSGKYLTTDGTNKSWGTVSQYALPTQTGNSGKFLTTNGTSESWGSAGINWTWRARTNNSTQVQGFGTNGSNIYVAVCDSGNLSSSTDSGVTWASRTSQFGSDRIHCVAFGNGIFVAVGAAGKISSSTDGITWTARTSGMSTNIINSVEFLNGNFVAVGAGANGGTGGITTSTDGITWTKRTTPTGMGTQLYSVTFGNGYYVAVGSLTTTAGCYSTNLSTWTVLPTSVNDSTAYATFQNNQFIIHRGNEANFFYTGNNPTTGWTASGTNGLGNISPITSADDIKNRIAYYDNKYWFLNVNGTMPMLMTADGGTVTAAIPGLNRPGTSYNLPIFASGTNTYSGFGAILINSTGGILISDSRGNIFTSF